MKLDKKAFGFGCGIVLAAWTLAASILSMFFGWGDKLISLLDSVYFGFALTASGIVVGMVEGFLIGFLSGWFIAYFNNIFKK